MKYTYESVPPEIREALHSFIEEQGLDCADNFRFTPVDDSEGEDQFEEIKEQGCCGSMDSFAKDNEGHVWFIGCNYGH